MALQFFDAAGATVTETGLFIPVGALPGLTAAELASSVPEATKVARFLFSFGKKLYSALSPASLPKLGYTVGRADTSNAIDTISRTFSYSITYVINIFTKIIEPLPLPLVGSNLGLGGFQYEDISSGMMTRLTSGNIPSAGVFIPTSDLTSSWIYEDTPIDVFQDDARQFVAALFAYVSSQVPTRTATVASAVTAKNRSNPTLGTLPANAVATTNPTTRLDPAQINNIVLVNYSWSYTVQTVDNQTNETFDVNVIAA